MDKECIKQFLLQAEASELQAFWEYYQKVGFFKGVDAQQVSSVFNLTACDELMDHLFKLHERLAQLDGDICPLNLHTVFETSKTPDMGVGIPCTVTSLAAAIVSEKDACLMYSNFISQIKGLDAVTEDCFVEILADEEEHLNRFKRKFEELYAGSSYNNKEPYQTLALPCATLLVVYVCGDITRVIAYVRPDQVCALTELSADDELAVKGVCNITTCTAATPMNCVECADVPNQAVTVGDPSDAVSATIGNASVLLEGPLGQVVSDSSPVSILKGLSRVSPRYAHLGQVMDSVEERTVNGKKMQVYKAKNAEEANKFIEENKGFVLVDQDDDGSVYLALESETEN